MKNFLTFKSTAGLFVAAMLLVSCAQSDQVVSNNFIQKRKYNKGFFVSKVSKSDNLAESKVQQKPSNGNSNVVVEETPVVVNYTTIQASANEPTPVVNIEGEVKKEETAAIEIKSSIAAKLVTRKLEKLIEKAEKAELNSKVGIIKKESKAAKKSGDNQIVALLLVLFVGGLGIHRFYLGYTWQGVVQLLTLGACGIWSLIDLIRIITGDLKPKTGGYTKTL